jgi:hypothetical protein
MALTASSACGQGTTYGAPPGQNCAPPPCLTPAPSTAPSTTPTTPSTTTESPATTPQTETAALPTSPATAGEQAFAAAGTTGSFDPLYIDNAIPRSLFRLRYDAARDDNRPDRAEFFYPKCGCFGGDAPGPVKPESSINYQEISAYLELAACDRFSGFVEVPVRFLNPEINDNTRGIGDINAGFKAAALAEEGQYVTFQFRVFAPTGDARRGLGTDHVSLEPALLLSNQVNNRLTIFGEVRDWIPIDGTDFAGNVVRYGLGFGYEVYHCGCWSITPIIEFVGWTVLEGKEFSPFSTPTTQHSDGDTIANAKFGARVSIGDHNDMSVSYGRALTGDVWYKEIVRLEYRLKF